MESDDFIASVGRFSESRDVIPKSLTVEDPPAIPHVATEDDVYEGHFIPEGS